MIPTKTYRDAISFIVSVSVSNYFNDLMNGGYGNHGSVKEMCLMVSHIYDIDLETVKTTVNDLIFHKEKDLKENWHKAVNGEYIF